MHNQASLDSNEDDSIRNQVCLYNYNVRIVVIAVCVVLVLWFYKTTDNETLL